jgi:hypothetical protein
MGGICKNVLVNTRSDFFIDLNVARPDGQLVTETNIMDVIINVRHVSRLVKVIGVMIAIIQSS